MMQWPWDRAQPDEWLPRSLRLCWGSGSDSDSSSGGGFDATTGGGDWGSAGAFDATGGLAGAFDMAQSLAFDAAMGTGVSTGPGEWGGWGSWATATGQPNDISGNLASFNAPNPTFEDVAGPNAGVTTGGGDWGSAGAFSAAGTGGGPGGAMVGTGGGGFYGGTGGGLFGDYSGGGGGGYTGGGGRGSSGGAFGGFAKGSDETGIGAPGGSPGTYGAGIGKGGRSDETGVAAAPTRGEAEVQSTVAPSDDPDSEPGLDPGPEAEPSTLGTPQSDQPQSDQPQADQPQSDPAPDVQPSATRGADPDESIDPGSAQYGVFGPESLTHNQDMQQLFQGTAPPGEVGRWGDLPGIYSTGISNLISSLWGSINTRPAADRDFQLLADPLPGWAQNPRSFELMDEKAAARAESRAAQTPFFALNTWLAPQNQRTVQDILQFLTPAVDPMADPNWGAVFEGAAPAAAGLASQLGFEDVGTTAPAASDEAVFEGAAPAAQDLAGQLGTQDIDTTNWGAVFEAPAQAPDYASVFEAPEQAPDWASVFEGTPTSPDWTSVFEGAAPSVEEAQPSIEAFIPAARDTDFATGFAPGGRNEAFIPAARDTDFEYASNAPSVQPVDPAQVGPTYDTTMESGPAGSQPSTDSTYTKGGDPALSGQAVDAATRGDLGTRGATVEDTAPTAPGINPSVLPEQSTAPFTLEAIANAIYGVQPNLPSTTPTQPTAQPQTAQPQTTPPSLVDMIQSGAGRAETSIPGGRGTDWSYTPASTDKGIDPGIGPGPLGDQPVTSTPPAPDKTDPPPGQPGLNEPQNVRNARDYLISTATPGDTMTRLGKGDPEKGAKEAIDRLHPEFALRLERAIKEARAEGIPASIFSAYRAPAFGVNSRGASGWASRSQHGKGAAVDVTGIGARDSQTARAWYDIAIRNGLFNPYGRPGAWRNPKEFNHFQISPQVSTFQFPRGQLGVQPVPAMPQIWSKVNPPGYVQPPGQTQQAAPTAPPGGWRGIGGDISREARMAQPGPVVTNLPPQDAPPADTAPTFDGSNWGWALGGINAPPAQPPPVNLPPQQDPAPRPQADIPIDIPVQTVPPALAARTAQAGMQFAKFLADNLAKSGKLPSNREEGQAALNALAQELAKAGYPASIAQKTILETATQGSIKAGYGPNSAYNLFGNITTAINEMAATAMQGYRTGKMPEVQGPPAPADLVAPGKRSEAPGLLQFARELTVPPDPNAPPPDPNAPPPAPVRGGRTMQAGLMDFLGNFNPISTAEARGGRSQAGNLQAPRADPGTIQGRLSSARSEIINELQTNLGLRNTLDLIVTGEVGSQGRAAVLGFLETAMNKVAAEASRDGRTATGRDLLNYLNDRGYFPDTWGKIESGKVKGGALTDDLLNAVAEGSNTTKGSTGNSSASSPGSRFGGNPTNATIGKEHYGVENYAHHAAWYNALGALPSDMPAVGAMPPAMPAPNPLRGLAKGGHVAEDETVVVGERGPEYFVPDWSRPAFHMPDLYSVPGNLDRWPKGPAPEYPGQYGGVEREIRRQSRAAQDIRPSLMDMINRGHLRFNPAAWDRWLNDPKDIALGWSRIEDRR